ncbi:MAG: hypothetical protein ACYS99_00430 [Planctomycetota bacterium]
MKTPTMRLLVLAASAGVLAVTLGVAAGGPGGEFELTIAGKVYPVDLDRPFTIPGPGGKPVTAVLRRAASVYAGHGVRFRHPADMTVEVKEHTGRVILTVEKPGGPFVQIQVFLVKVMEPDAVQKLTVDNVKRNVERAGVEFGKDSVKTSRRRVGSKTRKGNKLVHTFGPDEYTTEVYSFEMGGRVVSVLLQNEKKGEAFAKRARPPAASGLHARRPSRRDRRA